MSQRPHLVDRTEALIRRVKRDPAYRIDYDYRNEEMLEVLMRRGFEAGRGLFVKLRLARTKGVVFAGRHIVIRHRRGIRAGLALILGAGGLRASLGTRG